MDLEIENGQRAAMGSANRLKLGLFGANYSSGRAVTTVPERWSGSLPDCVRPAQMADRAGIEFMLPIGRWKGYDGDTDYRDNVLRDSRISAFFQSFSAESGLGSMLDADSHAAHAARDLRCRRPPQERSWPHIPPGIPGKVGLFTMHLEWPDLTTGRADLFDGAEVEISGWVAPIDVAECHEYFLLLEEPICCLGCLPNNPSAGVEVFAAAAIAAPPGPVRLIGQWRRLIDDPAGWLYQLRDARLVDNAAAVPVTRRTILSAGALAALAACGPPAGGADTIGNTERAAATRQLVTGALTVDIHSHAGRILRTTAPLEPVAAPMREGGMAVLCLAMVADSPATRLMPDRRIRAVREPEPGELYAWSRTAFARLLQLAEEQQLHIVADAAALRTALAQGPSIIVSAEGADFLDRSIERVNEAYTAYHLRHLQLTHYRVNDLGDIQTAPPVHGGLTDFGAEVVRTCNQLGIVVDTAHGTYELVKRAADVTTKPLVLSHTAVTRTPGPQSRQISPDHARVIAGTGGVIGVWPPSSIFPDLSAYVEGFARMADVVGVDHVGFGSDMLGLTVPSVFDSYRDLPQLAQGLLDHGFMPEEAGKILGGNYARVFTATVA